MKKVTDILDTLLMVAFMKIDAKSVELFQTAIDEVNATEAKIKELEKELAELKERASQGAINSLRGNVGGEYNATR